MRVKSLISNQQLYPNEIKSCTNVISFTLQNSFCNHCNQNRFFVREKKSVHASAIGFTTLFNENLLEFPLAPQIINITEPFTRSCVLDQK